MTTNFTNKTYSCLRAEAARRGSVSFVALRDIYLYFIYN
jgi:hypothetical protein